MRYDRHRDMHTREMQRRKRRLRERKLKCVTIALLCLGLAFQTVLIVRLANRNRKSAQLTAQIEQLNSDAVNYRLTIDSNEKRSALRSRAVEVLGMVEPTQDQIRVVNVPLAGEGNTQLVMNEPVQQ